MTAPDPWHATFVARWHAGDSAPWLAHAGDTVASHSHRMAVMALQLWTDDTDLLRACIAHDLGEIASGDVPFGVPPGLRAEARVVELDTITRMGMLDHASYMSAGTTERLRFLDRMDAYRFARLRAPHLMQRADWLDARAWLLAAADDLNALDRAKEWMG